MILRQEARDMDLNAAVFSFAMPALTMGCGAREKLGEVVGAFGRRACVVTDPKLENEVKLTVIATGFPSADASPEKDAEADEELKKIIGDDEALDIPPFLRHHPAARRRLRVGAAVPVH